MPEYAWEYLQKLEYGQGIWDIPEVMGKRMVAFMVREPKETCDKLPRQVPVEWRSGVVGYGNVFPVIVMAYFKPLDTIYEFWFNFYHPEPETEPFDLLAAQPFIYLMMFNHGPEALRNYTFVNNIGHFFRGTRTILSNLPPWTDEEFNLAKLALMQKLSVEDIWSKLGR